MMRDTERLERLTLAIQEAGLDAIVCALQKNVLMLTGYWPVVGTAIAILTKEGQSLLIAPQDERRYFDRHDVDHRLTFAPSFEHPTTLAQDIEQPLREALRRLQLQNAILGFELEPVSQEASYIASTRYGEILLAVVGKLYPNILRRSADSLLARERAVLTRYEQEHVRLAVAIAEQAFLEGESKLEAGMSEIEAAEYFRVPLATYALATETVQRAGGHMACMSGKNSGTAYGSFALSSRKVIGQQDLILIHCNSYADGYWTDITRTYFRGEMPERVQRMYEAIGEASQCGIAEVKAGVSAADVDRAVRDILEQRGFGEQFKHGTGHGVGFSAIDHRAFPRLQPSSPDIIKAGMIFNIEPGIYFEDFGGMRHCEMVLATETGGEVLTLFHGAR